MAPVMVLIILNILAGTTAASVYALWATKWAQRNSPGLATMNALIALVAAGIAITYAIVLITGDDDHVRGLRAIVSIALLTPALTRMLELRRDERREAYAERLESDLMDTLRPPDDK